MPLAPALAAALLATTWLVRRRWPWGRHRLARVTMRLLALFGAPAGASLLVLGRLDAVRDMPGEFVTAQRLAAAWTATPAPIELPVGPLVLATLGGGVVAGLIARVRGRPPTTLGNVSGLVPRTAGELGWGVLMSLVAGVCEELYFRLALPLTGALLGVGAVWGFGVSAALFGWAHRYQGPVGIGATLVVALLLTAAYLLTGQFWVAVALHAALDINGLVVRPVVAGLDRR